MSNGWRRKRDSVTIKSNWITKNDGSVVPEDVRIYPSLETGIYEIEISKNIEGIIFQSDKYDKYTLVGSVSNEKE